MDKRLSVVHCINREVCKKNKYMRPGVAIASLLRLVEYVVVLFVFEILCI